MPWDILKTDQRTVEPEIRSLERQIWRIFNVCTD